MHTHSIDQISDKERKKLYERFHSITLNHKNIISRNNFTHGLLIHEIEKLNFSGKTIKVLDVGCGTGAIDFYLASKRIHVNAIDISKRAITSCKANSKQFNLEKFTQFENSTIEEYSPKNKFDLVLCIEVIEHIPKDTEVLKKLSTLIKKNGKIIVSTPSINAPLFKTGFLNKFDKRVGHLRRYNLESLEERMKLAGFKIQSVIPNEGILRNFIFNSTIGGKIILRIINRFSPLGELVTYLDNGLIKLFGESDIMIIATKK